MINLCFHCSEIAFLLLPYPITWSCKCINMSHKSLSHCVFIGMFPAIPYRAKLWPWKRPRWEFVSVMVISCETNMTGTYFAHRNIRSLRACEKADPAVLVTLSEKLWKDKEYGEKAQPSHVIHTANPLHNQHFSK